MARLFTMLGALFAIPFIPLASAAGGFWAVITFQFDRAYFLTNRDILSPKDDQP